MWRWIGCPFSKLINYSGRPFSPTRQGNQQASRASEDRDEWTEEVRAHCERCYDDKDDSEGAVIDL